MWDLIAIVFLIAFVVFIVLAVISAFRKTGKLKRNLIAIGISFVVFLVAVSNSPTGKAGNGDKAALSSSPPTESNISSPKPTEDPEAKKKAADAKAAEDAKVKAAEEAKAAEDAKVKAAEEAKVKAAEEAKVKAAALAAQEKLKHPEWNMAEVDATKNGNLKMALVMIDAIQQIPNGTNISPQKVFKTPWKYYGKAIAFTGSVAVVEDFPPDSDLAKSGLSSEVVIQTDDSTIVDFLNMNSSGDLKVGDSVSITGYPIGRTEVDNKLGGKFTHLFVVTNRTN